MTDNVCKLPMALTLHLTESCNLRCKMCYEWGETGAFVDAGSGRKPRSMDTAVLKRLIKELAPRKPFYSLFGGEPFLHPNIEEIIVALKEGSSMIDTPTNGTLLVKHADMLMKTGFDSLRVSIDGPREINDAQRGKGSFDKAMEGIEVIHEKKKAAKKFAPIIGILYTVTAENHLSIEEFFLKDLNLDAVGMVTIQMQNFITEQMGESYARMMESLLGIKSDRYWRSLLRSPEDFSGMDVAEMVRQVGVVRERLMKMGKMLTFLPPKFTKENIDAYLGARWGEMTDTYRKCMIPWTATDITASGDVAPCHIFYDLVMGNIYEQSFEEIWNGERFLAFRKYMAENGLMSICNGCCILYMYGMK